MEDKSIKLSIVFNSTLLDAFLEFYPINFPVMIHIKHIEQSLYTLFTIYVPYHQ